jgi:spore protease
LAKGESLDLSRYDVRTDLALEAHQLAQKKTGSTNIPGVDIDTEDTEEIRITRVFVQNEEGEKAIGKARGRYVTMEIPGLRNQDSELQHRVTKVFAKEFKSFLQKSKIKDSDTCLVIGLGNWNVTPDALGPMVIGNLLVTRHLFELMPENVEEGYRNVAALSPGVLGITGIETSDIVYSVVNEIKPDFVIAVDALASRSLERVNTTIQISDTGIHPGSGIGNKRKAINKEALGIPVFAVGVPTVVDAVSVASDAIDFLLAHLGRQLKESRKPKSAKHRLLAEDYTPLYDKPPTFTEDDLPSEAEKERLMGMVGGLDSDEKRELIREVLQPMGHNLIVTPKEVDDFIDDIGNLLANGLNAALHHKVNMENLSAYTH